MSSTVKVLQPGPLSTIQDCGRRGYQMLGVSVSGAMDHESLILGNRLVGNDSCAAALEVTLGGASFHFDEEAFVAITGADLGPILDGLKMPGWTVVRVPAGGVIGFEGPPVGLRAYLCVSGGVLTSPQLGSRSTHAASRLGGLRGTPLAEGDEIPIGSPVNEVRPGRWIPLELRPPCPDGLINLRVVPGPQADAFSNAGLRTFYESEYTVAGQSDRQGIRFDGPEIESARGRYDVVSDAVSVGSIQVPGDGRPIVLMADRQTTGGYAKIGVVASVDLPLLAQAAPGASVRFHEINVEQAQELLRNRLRELHHEPLAEPPEAGEVRFQVNGAEFSVRIGAADPPERTWFTDAVVGDRQFSIHVERMLSDSGT